MTGKLECIDDSTTLPRVDSTYLSVPPSGIASRNAPRRCDTWWPETQRVYSRTSVEPWETAAARQRFGCDADIAGMHLGL